MNRNKRLYLRIGLSLLLLLAIGIVLSHQTIAVLQPAGTIAAKQRSLIYFTLALSLIIVLPVFGLLFFIGRRYREGHKGKYAPDYDGSKILETTWWVIPMLLIAVLSVVTWRATHELDPYKPISDKSQTPLQVQVVALEWKWLFIYPKEYVASVNKLYLPANRPVELTLTSDAPMNSFWVPQLGGQIYAMSGMSSKLHLKATKPGDYRGSSANISGKGFADMVFTAHVTSTDDFYKWVEHTHGQATTLTTAEYAKLAKPASVKTPFIYAHPADKLYTSIVEKYMLPADQATKAVDIDKSHHHETTLEEHEHMEGME